MARFTKKDEATPIYLQLDKGDNDQYPQAVIMDSSEAIVATIDLTNVPAVSGKYIGEYTFTVIGDYSLKFAIFRDAARTLLNSKYRFGDETIRVTDLEENVEKILDGAIGTGVADFG